MEEYFNPDDYEVPERQGNEENYMNVRMIEFKATFSPSVAYRLYDEFAPETLKDKLREKLRRMENIYEET